MTIEQFMSKLKELTLPQVRDCWLIVDGLPQFKDWGSDKGQEVPWEVWWNGTEANPLPGRWFILGSSGSRGLRAALLRGRGEQQVPERIAGFDQLLVEGDRLVAEAIAARDAALVTA